MHTKQVFQLLIWVSVLHGSPSKLRAKQGMGWDWLGADCLAQIGYIAVIQK